MFISATFSKPAKDVEEKLGKAYVKIRIWKNPSPAAGRTNAYIQESFTDKQSFTKNISKVQAEHFIAEHAGSTFSNCVVRTESEETTYMANRHGEIKKLIKKHQLLQLLSKQKKKKITFSRKAFQFRFSLNLA